MARTPKPHSKNQKLESSQKLDRQKFEHPFAHRKFTWNSSDIEWIEDHINLFSENSKRILLK